MNNKVKFLRGTSNEYAVAEKDSDTIYFTTDDGKLYIGDKEISGGGSLTIDDTLSDTSTNPVQNKVVKQAIDNKADSSHTHVKADITDFPASLPADGGNADTLDGKHANDFIYARGHFNSIDLDDIKYPCSGLALNCAHSPSSQWGTLLVYAGGTGSFTQIYIPTANDNTPTVMYFRHYGGTGWTAWRNTADGGNADTLDGLHASDIITSSKPYVTGTGVPVYSGGSYIVTTNHGFMPSAVMWWTNVSSGSKYEDIHPANSFNNTQFETTSYESSSSTRPVYYIIFK